jgi:uncharacterized membrane protein
MKEVTVSKGKSVQLMAAVYPNEDQAKVIANMLQEMHRAGNITLVDAALITKDEDGKVHVKETEELTTRKGARRGAIITGILGLIYPPSFIASVIAGGGIGALAGKLRDTGIKDDDIKEIADGVQPGNAAVVALAEGEWVQHIEQSLQGYDGRLITHTIDAEAAATLTDTEDSA